MTRYTEHVVPQFIIKAKNLSQSKVNNKVLRLKVMSKQGLLFLLMILLMDY